MALNLDERYPGRANPKSLSYPQGSFKNRTSPNALDGTYLEQDWANDQLAFFQSLIQEAGMTANGQVDTVGASQYFDALLANIRAASIPLYGTTPGSNVAPIIYALDRRQILLWQTIGTFEGYASAEVGDFKWGTSISPKPGTELLIGQTIDRTLPKYAALIAWAEVNGHMTASASWEKGAFHFSDMGANLIRLPDLRDQFIRATGTDADTANARGLGEYQADAFQGHKHEVSVQTFSGAGGSDRSNSEVFKIQIVTGNPVSYEYLRGFIVRYIYPDGVNGAPRVSSETRGINTALHPVITL